MPLEGLKVNTVFYLPAIVEVKISENNFIMISPFRKKRKMSVDVERRYLPAKDY